MNDTPRLMVADRDDRLRDHLVAQLLAEGLAAEPARTPAELRCRAARGPDLLVLGEFDEPTAALELLREIRTGDALTSRLDPCLAVVMMSATEGEWVPLRAFEAGCDDFVGKPLCRLADEPLRVFKQRELEPGQLERGAGAKRELLREVWGYRCDARTRTLDAHACRLRRKLKQAGADGHVVNRRGVGYRLVDRVPDAPSPDGASANGGGAAGAALERLAIAD